MKTLTNIFQYILTSLKEKLLYSYLSIIVYCVLVAITKSHIVSIALTLLFGITKCLEELITSGWKHQHKELIAESVGIIIAIILLAIQ